MKFSVKDLTLDQKIKLLAGKNTWELYDADGKLPNVFLADGPHGLRMVDIETGKTKFATAMPNNVVLANTWNKDLAYLQGNTIADDCIENNAQVLLAPGVNIKRTPLCGRNFEYISEDPYLAGEMAKAYISGVQDKGIGTSLKHYCLNNREYDRHHQTSEVDERTMREIYLPAFEKAMEVKPWTVMCAYNPINGIYASENKYLLNDVLRGEFGFDGLIMSDWGAVHHSARAVKATIDLEMPYKERAYGQIKSALDSGFLTEEEIDKRVEKVLDLMEKTLSDKKVVTTTKAQRHENARKIAEEGVVLLKNEDSILPLKDGKILVSGPCGRYGVSGGGGSSLVESDYPVKPLWVELKDAKPSLEIDVPPSWGEDVYESCFKGVIEQSYEADTVVLCVGTGPKIEFEGWDRDTIRLSKVQEDTIKSVASVNENVVVVIYAGSAIDVSPWADMVKGIVFAGFGGEAGNEAVASILTGNVNPSGKLTETFPLSLEDTPTGEGDPNAFTDKYAEGIFVGYRYYDSFGVKVAYPFGHGLSYSNFEYSNLKVQKDGDTDYTVTFDIKNNSKVKGKEIAQVYVRDVFSMVERPDKELKGFVKVELGAGKKKTVSVKLDRRAFAYYNVNLKDWHIENGHFEILIGASAEDIRLKEKIKIELPEETQFSMI